MVNHKSNFNFAARNAQFRRDEPAEISGKRLTSNRSACPLMYRVKWRSQVGVVGKEDSKWVPLSRLKYFLGEVEKYELANYDGPKVENPDYKNAPVDDVMLSYIINTRMAEQLTMNRADAIMDQKKADEQDFVHQPLLQTFDRPNSVVTLNLSLKQKYRSRHVSKQVTQGQYSEGDKAELVLNYIKLPGTGRYNFLVVWKKRNDGTRPHPSWVDEDAMRIVQPGFFNKMVKDKALQTQKS